MSGCSVQEGYGLGICRVLYVSVLRWFPVLCPPVFTEQRGCGGTGSLPKLTEYLSKRLATKAEKNETGVMNDNAGKSR